MQHYSPPHLILLLFRILLLLVALVPKAQKSTVSIIVLADLHQPPGRFGRIAFGSIEIRMLKRWISSLWWMELVLLLHRWFMASFWLSMDRIASSIWRDASSASDSSDTLYESDGAANDAVSHPLFPSEIKSDLVGSCSHFARATSDWCGSCYCEGEMIVVALEHLRWQGRLGHRWCDDAAKRYFRRRCCCSIWRCGHGNMIK